MSHFTYYQQGHRITHSERSSPREARRARALAKKRDGRDGRDGDVMGVIKT